MVEMHVTRPLLAALFLLGGATAPITVEACTTTADHHQRWREYEDQKLLDATLLFRGVVEDLRRPEGGDVTMAIRRTRSFWGHGAPERVVIPREYFSSCAGGNLHAAVVGFGEFGDLPSVRNGLGVTVLGRVEDAATPWDYVILVDTAADTQRVLRRFSELKRTQERQP